MYDPQKMQKTKKREREEFVMWISLLANAYFPFSLRTETMAALHITCVQML